jgi:hypothetical protein
MDHVDTKATGMGIVRYVICSKYFQIIALIQILRIWMYLDSLQCLTKYGGGNQQKTSKVNESG